jgi:hypothetical protein
MSEIRLRNFGNQKRPKISKPFRKHPLIKRLPNSKIFADKKGIVRNFVSKNIISSDFETNLMNVIKKIQKFDKIELPYSKIYATWGNRSAENIIKNKKIFIINGNERHKILVLGCMDYAVAAVASARILAKRMGVSANVYFVRWRNHSYVRVEFGKRNLLINTFENRDVIEISTGQDIAFFKKEFENGVYKEGVGPHEIGLNKLKDYYKY